jgi:predicted nucleotidyltransferase
MNLKNLNKKLNLLEESKTKFLSINEAIIAIPIEKSKTCLDIHLWLIQQGFTIEDINQFIKDTLNDD